MSDAGSRAYSIAGKPIPSWPPVHLKELWYTYLGQKSSSTSKSDKKNIGKFINKYTNPLTK